MKKQLCKSALCVALCIHWLIPQTSLFAQSAKEDFPQIGRYKTEDTGKFSGIFSIFQTKDVPKLALENSPRIDSLMHDGKLELSLSDALALALENNLDVAVQRYIPEFSQTDLLRSQAGQSPRGFSGGTTPGGLTSGALGAGISGSGAGSGVGSAGGITGGGGAVQVGSSGNFDPTLNVNFSYDRVTSPLNTKVVSGIYNVIGQTTAFTTSYAQLFSLGTSFSLTLNGQRQSSTQQNLLFNPASVTRFALRSQPASFERLRHACPTNATSWSRETTPTVAEHVFRLQVINTVVAVENAYWDLAALQESVRVAEQALAVAQQLHKDNQIRLDVGTMSPLDVTSAESEVAARTRDLTVAATNSSAAGSYAEEHAGQKGQPSAGCRSHRSQGSDAGTAANGYSGCGKRSKCRDGKPAGAATDSDQFEKPGYFCSLHRRRAEAELCLCSDFMPEPDCRGTSERTDSGLWNAFAQSFEGTYPEYAGGLSMSIPLRNRTAQADNLRSQLEKNQLLITQQRSRNTITMEVRKAIIGLMQGKAQVEAAHKASSLAREMWEGEKIKLEAGASTSYQVILRERDYTNARYAEVGAMATYAKAIVEMDRATGATLKRNNIEYSDALNGKVSQAPQTPFSGSGPKEDQ